eukprot:CAMPEP_0194370130 /NCGR_PEP_ID=MMETSP0174-20130528/18443_1 /TAXON_ID=216777 /ORGANISM="Proboscia alata, Strain PI-D3" /LENGTH=435 /DNA_ID=CAMNT_0039147427 /DNA_START=65 /DNA_END=1372 /DNA_ORIENTATION=+
MDLLGDLGANDQLTSTRAENKVLLAKVKELEAKVSELNLTNATLLAEVEMYRKDAALPSFSNLALGAASMEEDDTPQNTGSYFVQSGNGDYPKEAAVTLTSLHGPSNPLCCALHPTDDSLLVTGGADSCVSVVQWGAALSPSPDASQKTVEDAVRYSCQGGPVVAAAFGGVAGSGCFVGCGCMDGSVTVFSYDSMEKSLVPVDGVVVKHSRYVKDVVWSPRDPIVATSSADGTVYLTRVNNGALETVSTLHLSGPVEAMAFLDGDTLVVYVRDTPYLSYFDLRDDMKQTTHSLNVAGPTGKSDTHVSFAVLQLQPSPCGKFLACATDTSRQIIMEAHTTNQVRNLYGHVNDGFSTPKIGWSSNGQYLLGNTQEDTSVCVWDISSGSIVQRLGGGSGGGSGGGHSGQIRDVCSSPVSNTFVTASYDKSIKVWLPPM